MDRFSHRSRSDKDPPGTVIVFEPVKLRSGARWRVLAIAKAALLVWGGVSLAGVAAGAVVFVQGGFQPVLPAHETKLATPAKLELPSSPPTAQPTAQVIDVKASMARPATLAAVQQHAPAPQVEAAPVVEARLPQARPSEPLTTGSIGPKADAPATRRFRRLRDVQFRVPYAPGNPQRMLPPPRETDAAGRHIRHVWGSLPFQPHPGQGLRWDGRPR